MKSYPLFSPSFDLPQGRTRELFDELRKLKLEGKNDGSDELLALAELFFSEEAIPNVNYLPVQGGIVNQLGMEFLKFLCSFQPGGNPYFRKFVTAKKWKEVPLFSCCVHSATAGITASLLANGITSGEVITTSLNFMGVPNAIVLAGATPKFVDVNADNFCIDLKSLKEALNSKTKAIVLVHCNQLVDLEPIEEILKEHGLDIPVIQDASLAIGSTIKGMPAGILNLGDGGATVFSFATSKIISGMGGAVVVSNNRALIERVQSIAYQGSNFQKMDELAEFGANFKMNDMSAVIVMEQLKRRGKIFEKRRTLKSIYDSCLSDLADRGKISIQKIAPESIVTHYAILVPKRMEIAAILHERGIALGLWHVAHVDKIYQKRFGTKKNTLPVCESMADRFAFLPFYPGLFEKDVKFICDSLKKAIEEIS